MIYEDILIPNLFETPYAIQNIEINGELFFFEYNWNFRHEKAYISIYIQEDDAKNYILKQTPLTLNYNHAMFVFNERWSGKLFLYSNNSSLNYDYNIKNISSEFYLRYIGE